MGGKQLVEKSTEVKSLNYRLAKKSTELENLQLFRPNPRYRAAITAKKHCYNAQVQSNDIVATILIATV